jgi:hypothetical protein
MADIILYDKFLSNSSFSHTIKAPVERVDIAAWLAGLSEAEYCRCCAPDHISCGVTTREDGKPMSINVEMIGKTLMIQHYIAEVASPSLCRLVSTSDAFMPNGRSRVQVIWTLSVEKIDDGSCRYTNSVISHPTEDFMRFLADHGDGFREAGEARQHASFNHNRRETPLLAVSLESAALRQPPRLPMRKPPAVEPVRDILGADRVAVLPLWADAPAS